MSDQVTCPACGSTDVVLFPRGNDFCQKCAATWYQDARRPDPRLAALEAERDRLKHLLAHYSELAEEVGIDTSALEHGQCAFAAERDRLAALIAAYRAAWREGSGAALEARNEALAEAARLREDCAALTELAASRLADAEALRAIVSANTGPSGGTPSAEAPGSGDHHA